MLRTDNDLLGSGEDFGRDMHRCGHSRVTGAVERWGEGYGYAVSGGEFADDEQAHVAGGVGSDLGSGGDPVVEFVEIVGLSKGQSGTWFATLHQLRRFTLAEPSRRRGASSGTIWGKAWLRRAR